MRELELPGRQQSVHCLAHPAATNEGTEELLDLQLLGDADL